jgi:diguanylate cyclase (GGDEF)-like protein
MKTKQNKWLILMVGLALLAIAGVCDYLTGPEIDFALFFLIPVSLVTFYIGPRSGFMMAFLSGIVNLVADLAWGKVFLPWYIPFWSAVTHTLTYLIVALILNRLAAAWRREHILAMTDYVTGVSNTRYFDTVLAQVSHQARQSLTVIFLDVDNFKRINDTYGHLMGNEILGILAATIQESLRASDVVGRVGGDEFACLLMGACQAEAVEVVTRLQLMLTDKMKQNGWPVTFSIGVLFCEDTPALPEDALQQADSLMYEAKNNGKNQVRFGIYNCQSSP